MSHNSVEVVNGKIASSPNVGNSHAVSENDLTPESIDRLVARAKDIIAGRVRPPALVVPPEIEELLRREFAGFNPPPTPEAIRYITDRLSLEAHYKGQPVACFTTTEGIQAVLAVGEREIWPLLEGLSDEEEAKVVITDTLSC
jgi:hypothetical protein